MDAREAIEKAQAHLQNAMELVGQAIMRDDRLYMWDNQITVLDNFLADTEVVADNAVKTWRGKVRDVKKKLTDMVIAFEAAAEGAELDEDEPSPEEWVEGFIEGAQDMLELAKEALSEKVKDVQDLVKWEEPLSVINGYLADSEPFQEASRDLAKARSVVRVARRDIQNRVKEFLTDWRMNQEEDDGSD